MVLFDPQIYIYKAQKVLFAPFSSFDKKIGDLKKVLLSRKQNEYRHLKYKILLIGN